ncbi:MAG: polyamine aminopropyltransferase [Synergistaceae bacterium]|nr:polyamine aminopropyltransferase [Synergistaceae bacterium]MBQ3695140.1 polyamine aminopropyltransferase [Synergistaceae bacterium]MBQ6111225.1 polyamine aminopropyltransferase [Synergistaceae bacterium]MBQ9627812.1 polyamine aminopropyltransferase [Synergistaceae bacterium]MBR0249464.1 polyamine aminopropyltransferase [Synergistaceae bacterium]
MNEYVSVPRRANELWLSEYSTDNLKLSLRVKNILHSEKTQYQDLIIADTQEYGRTLMLDGAFQLTERDEFTYSEMMSHVPLCAHDNPENVLIIGGGDGAIMREVLRHECVKKCTLIDIDERVIESSKKYLPFAGCSFSDSRSDVKCMDAMKFIRETNERYDVVIIDSTDPVDFAAGLFQSGFYSDVKRVMNQNAFLSELTESPFTDTNLMRQAIREMHKVFPLVRMYWGVVPTYPSGMWTYGLSCMNENANPSEPVRNVKGTRYYTNEIHKASFILPPFLEDLIR